MADVCEFMTDEEYMMNINFPAVDETYIKQKVESSFYSRLGRLAATP